VDATRFDCISPLTKGLRDPLPAAARVKSSVSVVLFQVTLAGDHRRMLDCPAFQSDTRQAPEVRGLSVKRSGDSGMDS
jgi:hypothetical protein